MNLFFARYQTIAYNFILTFLMAGSLCSQEPSLLVDQARLDQISQAIQVKGSAHYEIFQVIKKDVDEHANSVIKGGDRVSGNWNYHRSFLASRAAAIYAVTKDTKYAKIAYDALHAIHADPDPDKRLLNDNSGLSRATLSVGFAIAYDLAGPAWTKEQRQEIHSTMNMGLDAWEKFSHPNFTSHNGSNWVAVCKGAELFLMLSAGEHDKRQSRLAELRKDLIGHLSNYGDHGWGQEGNGYVPYALRFLTPAAIALMRKGDDSILKAYQAKRPWMIPIYAGQFTEEQDSTQWGVGAHWFPPEGFTSLLLGATTPDALPYYKWFYDRHRGPLNPAKPEEKYDQEAGGNVYALLFYPNELEGKDPTGTFPKGIHDDKGGYWFRSAWKDGDDLVAYLGTDTETHGNAWDEADALQINIMGYGARFCGGSGTSRKVELFSQMLVDGKARVSEGHTGSHEHFEILENGGYAIADGGVKFKAFGLSSAKRHLLVDFPRGNLPFGIVASFDSMKSNAKRQYDWQLNTLGLPATIGEEAGLPTFTILGAKGGWLKGWVVSSTPGKLSMGQSLRCSWEVGNLDVLVVMATGKGSAPVATREGQGLEAVLRIADREVRYDATAKRIVCKPLAENGPVAWFTSSALSGISPLTIKVNAIAPKEGEQFSWSFGNGKTATGTSAETSLSPRGTHRIELKVTDQKGRVSLAEQPINVSNSAPIAAVQASPTSGGIPLEVQFDAGQSKDSDGHALTYEWDFGDGTKGKGQNVKHRYDKQGLYYATVTASDGHGDVGAAVAKITAGNQPPQARLSASVATGLPPLQVGLDATSSSDPEGDTLSFLWDFGDGTKGEGATTTKSYDKIGLYKVIVTASDGKGNSSSNSTLIRVQNLPPKAAFTTQKGANNETVNVDASASADPEQEALTYQWDFGDGTQASGATASHQYSGPGNYTIRLTVSDPRNTTATSQKSYSVLDGAGLRAADKVEGALPGIAYDYFLPPDKSYPDFNLLTIVSEGVANGINHRLRTQDAGYAFRFTGFLKAPTDGTYTFHYHIRDSLVMEIGSIQVINETKRLLSGPKTASATVGLKAGLHPIIITHHFGEISQPGWEGFFDLTWQPPGQKEPTAIPVENLFWKPGRPTASFVATEAPQDLIPVPTVNFIARNSPGVQLFYNRSPKMPVQISLEAGASYDPDSKIVSWAWDIGGKSDSGRQITTPFSQGDTLVTLTVTSEDGGMASSGTIIRVISPPESLNRAREQGKQVVAGGEDHASGGLASNAFDGNLTGQSRWLTYAEESWIELHFRNGGGRQPYVIDSYTLTNPDNWNDRDPKTVHFQASNDGKNWITLDRRENIDWQGNRGFTMRFDIKNQTAYSSYRWDVVPRGESPQGWIVELHEIELLDHGTGEQPINRPPIAAFRTPTSASIGTPVLFDATQSADPDGYPLFYLWDFGDGLTHRTFEAKASHVYWQGGPKNVTLTVRDSLGGTATQIQPLQVESKVNQPPTAAFTATPPTNERGTTVRFNASASKDPDGSALRYLWSFGDGTSGEGIEVEHVYSSGIYSAQLTVVDEQGARGHAAKAIRLLPASLPRSIGIVMSKPKDKSTWDRLYPGEYAGAVPSSVWNELLTADASNLRDQTGEPTTVSITTTNTTSRNGLKASPVGVDGRMMRRQAGSQKGGESTFTIQNIPFKNYDIYVYWPGSPDSSGTGTLAVTDGASTIYMVDKDGTWDGDLSEATATAAEQAVDGHEYAVFRNHSTPQITIKATPEKKSRAGIAAIQIIERASP